MKKWYLLLMASLMVIVSPNVKVEAASIGSDTIKVAWNMWASESYTNNIYASAGTVRVCAYGDNQGATTRVYVEERDEAGNDPEFIASTSSHNFYNSCWSFNVPSSLVDGTNKKAELRLYAERTDSFQASKYVEFSFDQ